MTRKDSIKFENSQMIFISNKFNVNILYGNYPSFVSQ